MNKYFAELVGTFVLVFGGVGSAVLAGSHIGFAGISAAFGLSLLAMVYTIGPISGCHVNPAVTLGVFLAKKINARDAAAYMVAQVIGAVMQRQARIQEGGQLCPGAQWHPRLSGGRGSKRFDVSTAPLSCQGQTGWRPSAPRPSRASATAACGTPCYHLASYRMNSRLPLARPSDLT